MASYADYANTWDYWWLYNREPFLFRSEVARSSIVFPGSDDAFMGRTSAADSAPPRVPAAEQIRTVWIPALLAAAKGKDPQLVSASLISLARIGGPRTLTDLFRSKLAHADESVSESAVLALGILGLPDAAEPLGEILAESSKGKSLLRRDKVSLKLRAFAAYSLGLLASSGESAANCEGILGRILGGMPEEGAATQEIQVACTLALGQARGCELKAFEALQRILSRSQDLAVQAHGLISLARLALRDATLREPVVQRFFAVLRQDGERRGTRLSAIIGIGSLLQAENRFYEEGLGILEETLESSRDEQEAAFALISLGRMGGPRSLASLLAALDGRRTGLRSWAALGLALMTKNRGKGAQVLPIAAKTLQKKLAGGGDPSLTGAYAIALGICGDPSSFAPLLESFERSRDPVFRSYCAMALGMIEKNDALPSLRKAWSKAPPAELLDGLAISLGLLGGQSQASFLLKDLRDPSKEALYYAAAAALGRIRDEGTLGPFREWLEGASKNSFRALCAAIVSGAYGDKEQLPWSARYGIDVNYLAGTPLLIGLGDGRGLLTIP